VVCSWYSVVQGAVLGYGLGYGYGVTSGVCVVCCVKMVLIYIEQNKVNNIKSMSDDCMDR
jgi:hypothetical protein